MVHQVKISDASSEAVDSEIATVSRPYGNEDWVSAKYPIVNGQELTINAPNKKWLQHCIDIWNTAIEDHSVKPSTYLDANVNAMVACYELDRSCNDLLRAQNAYRIARKKAIDEMTRLARLSGASKEEYEEFLGKVSEEYPELMD